MEKSESVIELSKSDIIEQIDSIIEEAKTHVEALNSNPHNQEDLANDGLESTESEQNYLEGNTLNDEGIQFQESDRQALMKHFDDLKEKSVEVNMKNNFLNKAISEYFSAKNVRKAFYDLTSEQVKAYTEMYHNRLNELYKKIQEYQLILEGIENEKSNLLKIKEEALLKKHEMRNDFRESIETSAKLFEASNQPVSEKLVARLFNRFQKVHNELSKIRCEYLIFKNSLDELMEKERKLDDLGDGFKMFDYENLSTELQTISSKIDAKNEELEKMRVNYHENIRKLQNFREGRQEFVNKIKIQKDLLDELTSEQDNLIAKLKELRNSKSLLKKKQSHLTQKSQLLTRPNLMLHFDKMEDELALLDDEFSKYEEENQKLEKQIREYEEKISSFKGENLQKKMNQKENKKLNVESRNLDQAKLKIDKLNFTN